jgi:hypothetical protein
MEVCALVCQHFVALGESLQDANIGITDMRNRHLPRMWRLECSKHIKYWPRKKYISTYTYLQEMIFDIGILNCLLRLDSVLGRHCVCRGQYNNIFSLLFCNLLNRWVLQCSMDYVGHCIVYAQELLTYKEIKSCGFWYCYWVSGWQCIVLVHHLRLHCCAEIAYLKLVLLFLQIGVT